MKCVCRYLIDRRTNVHTIFGYSLRKEIKQTQNKLLNDVVVFSEVNNARGDGKKVTQV